MIRPLAVVGLVVATLFGPKVAAQEGEPPVPVVDTRSSPEELASLSELSTARNYLAASQQEAIEVARRIDFLSSEYEHPSNMCGPLAAQILYDSGIIMEALFPSGEFNAHDFWLADPGRLESILTNGGGGPYDFVVHIQTGNKPDEYDFTADPLQLGDFLYTLGNIPDGGYDHMFVVTRIERDGENYRAYSTMNQPMSDGSFVIAEFLLYDSADQGTGLFDTWERSWEHGKTGQLGFELFRPVVNPNYVP